MTDFTQTVNESLNVFGGAISDNWNAYNWGAFKWGEGTNTIIVDTDNYIAESEAPTDSIDSLDSIVVIPESISVAGDPTSETLSDGSGYDYVFPSNQTNHENQSLATYTAGSNPNNSWSSANAGSTTWS